MFTREYPMRVLRLAVTAFLVLSLSACSSKDGKTGPTDGKSGTKDDSKQGTNADRIVGKWEGTKGSSKGLVLEFTKDGKLKTTPPASEGEPGLSGTYKIDGDTVEINLKGEPEKLKIKTLNDTTLIVVDSRGKDDEFKKK
jgi:uncharacterized protein (TIGR03066 family)